MPEDVIARAIAEQASRQPKELGALEPGIVVGFGELGLFALKRLQELLSASPAAQQVGARVQFLLVAPAGAPVPEGSGIEQVAVAPDWSADKTRLRHIDEWLSPDLARAGGAEIGIRQADRLAFFTHYPELRGRLQAARDRALEAAGAGAGACTIYLVAALGDETGSGMVLDLAHLAGEVLEDAPGGRVVGYLVLPASAGREESRLAKPGAFAALKELDFLNAGGELPVRYAAGAPSQVLRSPLFSACYLLDGRPGADGARGSDPSPAEAVALHIHADFLPGGVACTSRAVRERHARFARPGREDSAGCQTAYRAAGASRLHVDPARLNRGYRLALAGRLLDRALAPAADDLAARAARLTTPWSPGDLAGGLVKRLAATPDGASSLKETVGQWAADLEQRLEAEAPVKGAGDWLTAAIAELTGRFGVAGVGGTVAGNLAEAVRSFEAELDAELACIGTEAIGGSWFDPAIRFLEAAERRLEALHAQAAGHRGREAEVVAGCEDLVKDAVADADKAFGHPLARFGRSRRMVTERSLALLWRGLEELLIARLRLALWDAVPAFYGRAAEAIGRRLGGLQAVRGLMADLAGRVAQALDQVCREPARIGELFDAGWVAAEVAGLADRDPELLQAMAARLLSQLGAPEPLALAALREEPDFDVRLAAAVRSAGDEAARRVPPRTVADRLLQACGTESAQRDALRRAIEAAAPRLALVEREGAELPAGDACSLVVGIPGGPANPHGKFAALLDLLVLCLDDLGLRVPVSIADLPGPGDQVVFLRECAGFPLRSVAAIDDLAARYREHVRQPKADPVHIAKDPGAFETIPGIFPPDEKTKKRALEAFAVGVQWGVFEVENGIVVHRQKLPGMTFLDTRIIGTLDRPLRAVKYLIDHPELVQYAHGRIAAIVEDLQADPAKRQDRLARLERYYLRLLEQCRQIVTGSPDDAGDADDVIKKLPLWELAEAILAFNARHGLEAHQEPTDPTLGVGKSGALETDQSPALSDRGLPVETGRDASDHPDHSHAAPSASPEPPVPGLLAGHDEAAFRATIAEPAPSPELTVRPAAEPPPLAGPSSRPLAKVQCPECHSEWPATAKFCAECATPLQRAGKCPECQSPTPPGGKFCPECATPLLGQAAARFR